MNRVIVTLILGVLLISCGAHHQASPSYGSTVEKSGELARLVLILKEERPGQISHDWSSGEEFHLVPSATPRITFVSGRDCHSEFLECVRECMSRPLPRGFGHYTQGRGKGGKEDYCNQRCMRPYRDCMDLQDLKPREFSSSDAATDWLKQNYKAIVAGGVVIIAGVAFVVISVSAGVLVLIPAALMVSTEVPMYSPMAVAP